jgi:iron complex outermembrane receptor protein
MNRTSLLSGLTAAACAAVVSTTACAQAERDFDIPPGELSGALRAFATQSDQQIFFAADLVAGLRSQGVRGRLTSSAALDRIVAGSGLGWAQSRPGVFVLQPRTRADLDLEETVVEEVIVTGSLLRASGELASPVLILDREALDDRGFGTVAETLAALPQNYAGAANPVASLTLSDPNGGNASLATGVNLRGLGPDATLVLVNGRRIAGSGSRGELADVSALPSSAVERVDVLLDGASALYGSDAVAGVVNVIMRRSFDGQESRVRLAAARDGVEDVIASHLVGRSWDTGSVLASYEYQQSNGLNSLDRDYTADADLRPFGGSDRRQVFSGPGNIVAFDAVARAYVSRFAIRPGADGVARTPADFAANQANLSSQLLGVDLSPDVDRHSAYGRVRQSIGDRLEVSADVRFSRRSFGFDNGATVSILTVNRNNPFFVSPSGATSHTIAYSFFEDLGTTRRKGVSRSVGITAGAALDLGRDWSLDGYLSHGEERGGTTTFGRVNSLFLNEALGVTADNPATDYSPARDGYFNPFSGNANGPGVLAFIGSGYGGTINRSRAQSANLLASGPVVSLPGGDLELAVGLQGRRETFRTRSLTWASTLLPVEVVTPVRERDIAAVFAEARIPIVGEDNAMPGIRRLELSIAGRVEEYDDFGTTSNPKVGLVWSPASDLTFRASYGTSFRAPALTQLYDRSGVSVTTVPRADGANVLALYRSGGNPDLQPETASTWTAGFDYARPEGFRLSVNAFETRFSDRISQPVAENVSGVLTNPSVAPFVRLVDPLNNAADLALVRSFTSLPTFTQGALYPDTSFGVILDARWVNATSVEVRGLDVTAAYPVSLGVQTVTFDAGASYILDYDMQTTLAAPRRSVVGIVGYPVRLRSRAGATWSRGNVSAGLHWNHVAAYEDGVGVEVEAWNTADLLVSWSPDSGALSDTRLVLTALNLFDADPPFYNGAAGFGFDPAQANPLGRAVAFQIIRRW